MASSKVEFAVQMTCESCVEAVRKCLEKVEGIQNVEIDLKKGSVVVDSNLAIRDIQRKLESTGRKVVVKGQAGSLAAVSILECSENNVQGVVRFLQPEDDVCIIDGTIDGLESRMYQVSIHECGDLSKGCSNVGDVYNPKVVDSGRIYGDLGTVIASKNGRAAFRLEDHDIKISEIIGRSLVIKEEGETVKRIAAGIIARSAGLFQNPKTICACDGVTIWDEVSKRKSSL